MPFCQGRRKNRKGSSVARAASQTRRSCHQDADCGHASHNNSSLFSGNGTGTVWLLFHHQIILAMRTVVTVCHIHHWCGDAEVSDFAEFEFAHRRSKFRNLNFRHRFFSSVKHPQTSDFLYFYIYMWVYVYIFVEFIFLSLCKVSFRKSALI